MEPYVTLWNTSLVILVNFMEHYGTLRNLLEPYVTLWYLMEP